MKNRDIIYELYENAALDASQLKTLIETCDDEDFKLLEKLADKRCSENYGDAVFLRGLIEISSYCKNDCLYCGIRRSNRAAERYRLSEDEIMSCCENGYALGFRTFVLQGGEDGFFTDDVLCEIVGKIKKNYPDCAVTLSLGERSKDSYQRLFDAGADRYLLRHETADKAHYEKIHPPELSFENRMNCLKNLKEIGFQTGCGFMVGSPFQTTDDIVKDLLFIKGFEPQMVGIGPFISHKDTPFAGEKNGSLKLTLLLLTIIRLLLPKTLIPATTALGTISPNGREKGLEAGANVVMPNLSPVSVRKKYSLYDNKICTGEEAAECKGCLERRIKSVGKRVVCSRGDALM